MTKKLVDYVVLTGITPDEVISAVKLHALLDWELSGHFLISTDLITGVRTYYQPMVKYEDSNEYKLTSNVTHAAN